MARLVHTPLTVGLTSWLPASWPGGDGIDWEKFIQPSGHPALITGMTSLRLASRLRTMKARLSGCCTLGPDMSRSRHLAAKPYGPACGSGLQGPIAARGTEYCTSGRITAHSDNGHIWPS